MHIYIHEILIPKMLELMSNDTTKYKLLENYDLATLCKDTVGEWLINIAFKYDCYVKNYYVDGHENKDIIKYIRKFTDCYRLLETCMFIRIQMTPEGSEQYKGCDNEKVVPG